MTPHAWFPSATEEVGALPPWVPPRWHGLARQVGLHDATWTVNLKRCAVASLVIHVLVAWVQHGFHQCDEHFQILEYMGMKLGLARPDELAWEFGARIRSWFQPGLYTVLVSITGVDEPLNMARLVRVVSSLLGWIGSVVLLLGSYRFIPGATARKWTTWFVLLCYLPFYLHARTSAENLSSTLFALAVGLLLATATPSERGQTRISFSIWILPVVGMLLACTFLTRFQTGFMLAGLGLWCLWTAERRVRLVVLLGIGFTSMMAAGTVVDAWGYGEWTFPAWNYFHDQLVSDGVSRWGVSPWWFYLPLSWTQVPGPFGLLLLLMLLVSWVRFPRHPFTWITVPFVVAHCLIGHKEARFLFPVLLLQLTLVAGLLPPVRAWEGWKSRVWLATVGLLALVNVAMLAQTSTVVKPREIPVIRALLSQPTPTLLLTLDKDPFVICERTLHFYKPRELEVKRVDSRDDALQQVDTTARPAYVYRESRGVPVEDEVWSYSCERIYTSQWPYIPGDWASEKWVQDLYARHHFEELYHCAPHQVR